MVLNTAAPHPSCTSFTTPKPVAFKTAFGLENFLSPMPKARLHSIVTRRTTQGKRHTSHFAPASPFAHQLPPSVGEPLNVCGNRGDNMPCCCVRAIEGEEVLRIADAAGLQQHQGSARQHQAQAQTAAAAVSLPIYPRQRKRRCNAETAVAFDLNSAGSAAAAGNMTCAKRRVTRMAGRKVQPYLSRATRRSILGTAAAQA
jgi:hypothetical protein